MSRIGRALASPKAWRDWSRLSTSGIAWDSTSGCGLIRAQQVHLKLEPMHVKSSDPSMFGFWTICENSSLTIRTKTLILGLLTIAATRQDLLRSCTVPKTSVHKTSSSREALKQPAWKLQQAAQEQSPPQVPGVTSPQMALENLTLSESVTCGLMSLGTWPFCALLQHWVHHCESIPGRLRLKQGSVHRWLHSSARSFNWCCGMLRPLTQTSGCNLKHVHLLRPAKPWKLVCHLGSQHDNF